MRLPWFTSFGDESYIKTAFEFARKYTLLYNEPQIKLYYNDYSTSNPTKANGIVKLCKPIYEAGLLDGIGMQEHDNLSTPSAQNWINSYNKFYAVCDEMAVTEIDVSTNSNTNSPSDEILEKQANQYAALFKCFVERSAKSGRGKIVNVTKDGLNDEFTFVKNQSSSLWDVFNREKPAFYAVVKLGLYYNKLDSLISAIDNMQADAYSEQAWEKINETVNVAKDAMLVNYSALNSAVDALNEACVILENTLANPTNVDDFQDKITFIVDGDFICIDNLPEQSQVMVYAFNGMLLCRKMASQSTTIYNTQPCIVRIINGRNVWVKKALR